MNPRLRLLLVLLLPFVACGVQWLLWDDRLKPYAWVLFYPVAFVGARLGGLKGGIGVTAISALLVWYLFLPPRFSFELETASGGFSIAVFVVMGGLFGWVFERLRRAQALARAAYDATFDQAAVGIGLVAPDGRWLRVNRRLCSILGYTPAELMAKTAQDITHPDDLDADLDQVRRMLAREIDSYSREQRYRRKDGGIVWINLTVSLVWMVDGAPDHFVTVVEDISARKAVDAALRESERTYRSLFDGMLNGFARCRMLYEDGQPKDYLFLDVNPAFERQTGLRDVVGRKVSDVIPGIHETDPELLEHYARVARGGQPESFEVRVEALQQWFAISVYSPAPDHFVAVFDVITARRQAEQRFAQLFEQAPVALSTSNRDGRIILMNRAFVEMFGYRIEDTPTAAEWRARVLADAGQRTAADAAWNEKWRHGEARAEMVEHAVICRDGRRRTVLLSRQRLGEEIMLAAIDISERKEAELKARRQIDELERFHRASVGRELDMIGLKREVNALARELGRAPRYDLSFAEDLDEKDRP